MCSVWFLNFVDSSDLTLDDIEMMFVLTICPLSQVYFVYIIVYSWTSKVKKSTESIDNG